jgi:hypothetical protein
VNQLSTGTADRFFVRLSRYEDFSQAEKFEGKVRWLWVDCFDRKVLSETIFAQAFEKFNLCLVSPELQGGNESDLPSFLPQAKYCQAICTKIPLAWKQLMAKASVL